MYANKLLAIAAFTCSLLSACSSLPMVGKQNVKILAGATVVMQNGERYYFDATHIFDGKQPADFRKVELVSETHVVQGYVGTGYGIYSLGTDDFRFFLSGYIGENGTVTVGDSRLLKKETVQENGRSWDVFYVCDAYVDDTRCKTKETWKVTPGDIFHLKRNVE